MGYHRDAMCKQVRRIWISGVLDRSLYRQTLIELGLQQRLDAREYPWDVLVERIDHRPATLKAGADLAALLEDYGSLLILGAPGAGKTTMLLELAKRLLESADVDKARPAPVVFQLASWAASRKP
ncbi:hypothetical protein GCM10027614_40900 [Micromonospora vulcania]